jgi:hypothetical protein
MIQFHVLESAIRPAERPAGDSTYRHLTESVLDVIRRETFGVDVGQDSGLTVEEYERFVAWLRQTLEQHVQELVSGEQG